MVSQVEAAAEPCALPWAPRRGGPACPICTSTASGWPADTRPTCCPWRRIWPCGSQTCWVRCTTGWGAHTGQHERAPYTVSWEFWSRCVSKIKLSWSYHHIAPILARSEELMSNLPPLCFCEWHNWTVYIPCLVLVPISFSFFFLVFSVL